MDLQHNHTVYAVSLVNRDYQSKSYDLLESIIKLIKLKYLLSTTFLYSFAIIVDNGM